MLLADDQALFLEGLETLLSVHPDIQIVGLARNGVEAVTLARETRPDIILMDIRMPELNGVGATRRLKAELPDCKIIILTTFDDDEFIFDALRAGAVGYLLKDVAASKLVEAIRQTQRGESILDPGVTAKVIAEFSRVSGMIPETNAEKLIEPLSDREMDILRLIATGASNREIGEKLYIAEGTVKNHVTNILGKLGVHDRTQAALKAREMGLI